MPNRKSLPFRQLAIGYHPTHNAACPRRRIAYPRCPQIPKFRKYWPTLVTFNGFFTRVDVQQTMRDKNQPSQGPVSEAVAKDAQSNNQAAHRARIRQRILEKGAETLTQLELLEVLLFAGNPRGDTKPLAKQLMREFGSLNAVLSSSAKSLGAVPKMGHASIAAIKTAEATALYLSHTEIIGRTVLSNWAAVQRHCVNRLAHKKIEHFLMISLDHANAIIGKREISRGTVDQAPIYVREVVTAALQDDASAVLLVHNHPSGNLDPSRADIDMTHAIQHALSMVTIKLHDHLIVAGTNCTSMRSLGHL